MELRDKINELIRNHKKMDDDKFYEFILTEFSEDEINKLYIILNELNQNEILDRLYRLFVEESPI